MPVTRDPTGKVGIALNFEHLYIPHGVTVRFRGFNSIHIHTHYKSEIDGTIDASGGDGEDGENGAVDIPGTNNTPPWDSLNLPSGAGGDGGDGPYGQGAGGYGGYQYPQDNDGAGPQAQASQPMRWLSEEASIARHMEAWEHLEAGTARKARLPIRTGVAIWVDSHLEVRLSVFTPKRRVVVDERILPSRLARGVRVWTAPETHQTTGVRRALLVAAAGPGVPYSSPRRTIL